MRWEGEVLWYFKRTYTNVTVDGIGCCSLYTHFLKRVSSSFFWFRLWSIKAWILGVAFCYQRKISKPENALLIFHLSAGCFLIYLEIEYVEVAKHFFDIFINILDDFIRWNIIYLLDDNERCDVSIASLLKGFLRKKLIDDRRVMGNICEEMKKLMSVWWQKL